MESRPKARRGSAIVGLGAMWCSGRRGGEKIRGGACSPTRWSPRGRRAGVKRGTNGLSGAWRGAVVLRRCRLREGTCRALTADTRKSLQGSEEERDNPASRSRDIYASPDARHHVNPVTSSKAHGQKLRAMSRRTSATQTLRSDALAMNILEVCCETRYLTEWLSPARPARSVPALRDLRRTERTSLHRRRRWRRFSGSRGWWRRRRTFLDAPDCACLRMGPACAP